MWRRGRQDTVFCFFGGAREEKTPATSLTKARHRGGPRPPAVTPGPPMGCRLNAFHDFKIVYCFYVENVCYTTTVQNHRMLLWLPKHCCACHSDVACYRGEESLPAFRLHIPPAATWSFQPHRNCTKQQHEQHFHRLPRLRPATCKTRHLRLSFRIL